MNVHPNLFVLYLCTCTYYVASGSQKLAKNFFFIHCTIYHNNTFFGNLFPVPQPRGGLMGGFSPFLQGFYVWYTIVVTSVSMCGWFKPQL